jgi:fructosamine-3-kinase
MEIEFFFSQAIFESLGKTIEIRKVSNQGGGCINNGVLLETNLGSFFLKFNDKIPDDMFKKESLGLTLLNDTGIIRTPKPLGSGKIDDKNYLILEYIAGCQQKKDFWEDFGTRIARLHKECTSGYFGLEYDNYIGKLPQVNTPKPNWIDFFIWNRLETQIELALKNNLVNTSYAEKFRMLYKKLPALLPDYPPSLLHGDLWGGNFMTGNDGTAVLIDPAVYYGNREIELAFTRMFGGFDEEFYSAYQAVWPLEKGFDERVDIYNLYPALVHLNLFGTAYLGQITHVINRYV